MQIRKAKIEDIKSIRELNRRLFEQDFAFDNTLDVTWPDREETLLLFQKNITDDKYYTQVAVESGRVVGYMVCKTFQTPAHMRPDLKMAELEHTFIEPEHRKKGIGIEMFENFEIWAKEKGCNLLTVTAAAKNVLAKDFYTKVGFELSDITFQKKI